MKTPVSPDHANIALTGFMGAGKTAAGQGLARALDWPFVDLDAVIEEREGAAVRELFARHGEGYFREREKAALRQVLEGTGQVIALGGGAVVDPANLRLVKERSLLVWLRVSPRTVLLRTSGNEDRPLLGEAGGDRLQRIAELSAQREAVYGQADLAVDTDALTVEQVVQRIRQQLCRP